MKTRQTAAHSFTAPDPTRHRDTASAKSPHCDTIPKQCSHCDTAPRLALAGNPNVGKSVVFQALTGLYAEVSNYPGTTVDITSGRFGSYHVIDTPGVFSLADGNDEERVARDALLDCDCILNILDATHLKRDLFLTLQLLALGKPMLLAVNLMDQAEKSGIRLDLPALSRILGVKIIPIAAAKGIGLDLLKESLPALSRCTSPDSDQDCGSNRSCISDANDPNRSPNTNDQGGSPRIADTEEAYTRLREEADRLAAQVVRIRSRKPTCSDKLGHALLNPLTGIPCFAALLCLLFFFIGRFLSSTVVDFTEGYLMGDCYYHFIFGLIARFLPPDSFLGNLLIGEYGLLTMVPTYLFGLLLPLLIGFYFSLALLEDSGLLPRIAVLCDRFFMKFGLNGKAVIPLLLGFGCVTMALVTTRILGTKRERLIASVLLCIAVPCSAQFSVIMVIAGTLPPFYLFCYTAVILSLFFLLGSLLNRFLPGTGSDLFLALPPLRLPGLKNGLQKTAMKSKHFLRDAGPMFLIGSLLISTLFYTDGFVTLRELLLPLTEGLLGLPGETATLFLMSIIKRDLGAAYLHSMASQGLLSFPQMTVALTVMTLFVPCFASLAILFKERGAAAACAIWLGSLAAAFGAGGLMTLLLQ